MKPLLLFMLLLFKCFAYEYFSTDKAQNLLNAARYKILPFDTPVSTVYKERDGFTPLNKTNIPYGTQELWAYTTLTNPLDSPVDVILEADLIAMNYLDFYIYSNGALVGIYKKGALQNSGTYNFFNRSNAVKLTLPPRSSMRILVAMKSQRLHSLGMHAETPESYLLKLIKQSLIMVLLAGLLVAAASYNFSIFLNVRLKEFALYALGGILFLFQIFFQYGFFSWLNPFFPVSLAAYGYFLATSLILLPTILFAQAFFETKKHHKRLHLLLNVQLFASILLVLLYVYSFLSSIPLLLASALMPVGTAVLLTFFLLGILAALKKYSGALLYLCGQGSIIIVVIANIILTSSQNYSDSSAFMLTAASFALDIIFLALALGTKLKKINKELQEKRKAIEISTRDKAIAQTVKNISHQWKAPLVQLSALVTKLEFLNEHAKEHDTKSLAAIEQANSLIAYMSELTTQYQNLYKLNREAELISIAAVLDNIQSLMSQVLKEANLHIYLHVDTGCETLRTYKNTLMQILIIIIDNIAMEAVKRKIKTPETFIQCSVENQKYMIVLSDNIGGITITPIENIFKPDVSESRDGTGHGLYLAKELIHAILKGEIYAANVVDGASFTLQFDTLQQLTNLS